MWSLGLKIAAGITLAFTAEFAVCAQNTAPLTFEAAAIKPNHEVTDVVGIRSLPGGRVEAHSVTLKFLIQDAYGLPQSLVTGGPAWIAQDRFDLTATPGIAASRNQVSLMMQTLLEERFKLKVHREQREMSVYFLVPVKSGMKLSEAKEGSCIALDGKLSGPALDQTHMVPCGAMTIRMNDIQGSGVSMAQLTSVLTNIVGRTVVDQTGFAGTFDLHLEFAREGVSSGGLSGPAPPNRDLPSIFTALRERLGLRLDSGRAPVEILVIDHAERPQDN